MPNLAGHDELVVFPTISSETAHFDAIGRTSRIESLQYGEPLPDKGKLTAR
jgi:hypothetical protein